MRSFLIYLFYLVIFCCICTRPVNALLCGNRLYVGKLHMRPSVCLGQSSQMEQKLIEQKLSEWKILSKQGMLGSNALHEEDFEELDRLSALLRKPQINGDSDATVRHTATAAVQHMVDHHPSVDTVSSGLVFDIARRLALLKSLARSSDTSRELTASKFYALLCEVRDKKAYDVRLIEDILMSLSRVEVIETSNSRLAAKEVAGAGPLRKGNSKQLIAAYQQYTQWLTEGCIAPSTSSSSSFLVDYVLSLYQHNAVAAAEHCRQDLVARAVASDDEFLPGAVCAGIHHIFSNTVDNASATDKGIAELLAPLVKRISLYRTTHLNLVIRTLGRYHQVSHIFVLLRAMKSVGVHINTETQELLTQCMVKGVSRAGKAEAMADLPAPDRAIPEVVFVGRSNVGKSSLVNYLLNRKMLAPTSATPGFTRAFHFYSVNQPPQPALAEVPKIRQALPGFRLVDVPGLGYAGEDTGEDTQRSWQGLLSRYLSRRDPLKVVFHLIDARHGVTAVDKEMVAMARAAARERAERQSPPFRYVFVLTKADKVDSKRLSTSLRELQSSAMADVTAQDSSVGATGATNSVAPTIASGTAESTEVIVTSAVDRSGAEEVWEVIHHTIA